MKKLLFILIISFLFSGASAQENTALPRHKVLNLSLGGLISSFQDEKFSTEHYNGFGARLHLDFSWSKESYWEVGTNAIIGGEQAKTYDVGAANAKDFNLYLLYMYPVIKSEKQQLLLGIRGDYRFYLRKTNELSNNTAYMIIGPNLKFNGRYVRSISDKWTLDATLRFQLLGWVYEGMSFTYSTSQQILVDGKYNYNDVPINMNSVPFWKYFTITTIIQFNYGKRWGFGYRWHMEQSYQVKNYTMTMGQSELYVSYRIINRLTEKKHNK